MNKLEFLVQRGLGIRCCQQVVLWITFLFCFFFGIKPKAILYIQPLFCRPSWGKAFPNTGRQVARPNWQFGKPKPIGVKLFGSSSTGLRATSIHRSIETRIRGAAGGRPGAASPGFSGRSGLGWAGLGWVWQMTHGYGK